MVVVVMASLDKELIVARQSGRKIYAPRDGGSDRTNIKGQQSEVVRRFCSNGKVEVDFQKAW